jgi:hypothetical protein
LRFVGFAFLIACTWWPALGAAQNAADIDKIADMMVRLCVGGGHTEATSATGTGGADLSLRSLDVKGDLQGEFKISKSSAEGLANGLDNALSQVAADQADKARVCLQPVRERLLDAMLPPKRQGSAGQTVTAPGGVAVGGDVKGSPITINPPPQPSVKLPDTDPGPPATAGGAGGGGTGFGRSTRTVPTTAAPPTPATSTTEACKKFPHLCGDLPEQPPRDRSGASPPDAQAGPGPTKLPPPAASVAITTTGSQSPVITEGDGRIEFHYGAPEARKADKEVSGGTAPANSAADDLNEGLVRGVPLPSTAAPVRKHEADNSLANRMRKALDEAGKAAEERKFAEEQSSSRHPGAPSPRPEPPLQRQGSAGQTAATGGVAVGGVVGSRITGRGTRMRTASVPTTAAPATPATTAAAPVLPSPPSAHLTVAEEEIGNSGEGELRAIRHSREALEKLPEGKIVLDAPATMKVGETRTVHANVGIKVPIQTLRKYIKTGDQSREESLKVSSKMSAALTGSGFKITATTPEKQNVAEGLPAVWSWDIEARQEGEQELEATLYVELPGVPQRIDSFKHKIGVTVKEQTWGEWLKSRKEEIDAVKAIGLAVIGTITAVFSWLGWSYNRRRKDPGIPMEG